MALSLPPYTAVIRSLGKAGKKYQTLLDSLIEQTHKPSKIIVYLAEGYERPKETVNVEEFVFAPRGMVAQRALQYHEVNTEWILFLDDDMSIEPWGVEKIFTDTIACGADVCAIDGFPHHIMSLKQKLGMALLLSSLPRFLCKKKGYTINCLGVDMYNPKPKEAVAWSTLNSGNAFICKKIDFLKIHFEEDKWLDDAPYAFPEDKVMFYKMHLHGLSIITHYKSGFKHLDAATAVTDDRLRKLTYSVARNKEIFNNKYFIPSLRKRELILFKIANGYRRLVSILYDMRYSKTMRQELNKIKTDGINSAYEYLKSPH